MFGIGGCEEVQSSYFGKGYVAEQKVSKWLADERVDLADL